MNKILLFTILSIFMLACKRKDDAPKPDADTFINHHGGNYIGHVYIEDVDYIAHNFHTTKYDSADIIRVLKVSEDSFSVGNTEWFHGEAHYACFDNNYFADIRDEGRTTRTVLFMANDSITATLKWAYGGPYYNATFKGRKQ